jgi:hypothetical protein
VDDRAKQQQWASFVESVGAELPSLIEIIDDLAAFLMPHVAATRTFKNLSG